MPDEVVYERLQQPHSSCAMTRGHPRLNMRLRETKARRGDIDVVRASLSKLIFNPKNRGTVKALIHAWCTHINPHTEHVIREPIGRRTLIRHRPIPTTRAIPSLNCARMQFR